MSSRAAVEARRREAEAEGAARLYQHLMNGADPVIAERFRVCRDLAVLSRDVAAAEAETHERGETP